LSKGIFRKRLYFIKFINKKLPTYVTQIGLKGKKLNLKYKSKLKEINIADFENEFRKKLKENLSDEIRRGRTLIGPHRDDFEVILEDKNAAFFASRGETRGIVLALKLAELSFSKEVFKIKPILLLDDIFSELDFEHRRNIVKIARDQQTIITTTELELIGKNLVQEAEVVKINSPL
jgi:DNA replication and repair protein RecF